MLHPTAVIDPAAQLGAGVRVGPYAIIEGGAKIGDGCVIEPHAIIGASVTMGRSNSIGCGAIIGAAPQALGFQTRTRSEVIIGNNNQIREYCTIHRGSSQGSATIVGDDCFLMAGAHLGHDVRVGDRVIIANNVLLGGHVVVSDGVFLGGGSVLHQFVRIGRLAICQGMSAASKDIPPFTIAAGRNRVVGLNVVGLRRASLNDAQRTEIKRAFDLLYRSGRNTRQALAAAGASTWGAEGQEFFDFVAEAKKRGICALRWGSGDAASSE
jgi:UDP-N-acetylglucosamine acyltransferase